MTLKPDHAAVFSPPAAGGRFAAGEDPAKRQQILAGAKRVFMKMGFDAASMNDVTREAGVPRERSTSISPTRKNCFRQ